MSDRVPAEKADVLAEGTSGRLARNTLINALAGSAGLVVSLLLTPLMIDYLGAASYGIWALSLLLTLSSGYLSLSDFGIQQSAVRFIAEGRQARDQVAIDGYYTASLLLFSAIALALTPVVVLLAPLLADAFGINSTLRNAAVLTFQFVAAQILFDLPAMAPRAKLEGAQLFAPIRLLDLGRVAVTAAVMIILLLGGYGIVALAVASLVIAAASSVAFFIAAHILQPETRIHPRAIRRSQLRALLRFGGGMFAIRIISVLYRQIDKVVIGIALTVVAVAQYEVASKVQGGLAMVTVLAASALLPAASYLKGEHRKLRDLYLEGTTYSVALAWPLTFAVMLYAEPLISGWIGESFAVSADYTRIFLIWIALGALDTINWTLLVVGGRLKIMVLLNALWVTANIALSIILVGPLGVAGPIWATVISYVPLSIAYTVLSLKHFDVKLSEWARKIILRNVPGALVQVLVFILLEPVLDGTPFLLHAAVGSVVGIALSVGLFLFVGLNGAGRTRLFYTLRSATGR